MRVLLLAIALAGIPRVAAFAQGDTLIVEMAAIIDLLGRHARSRTVVLDDRFAMPGQAPPNMTSTRRPPGRQRILEEAIAPLGSSIPADTLLIRASAPSFTGAIAAISVTVGHRGPAGMRRAFYETVEYQLRLESGRWVIYSRNQLGIS